MVLQLIQLQVPLVYNDSLVQQQRRVWYNTTPGQVQLQAQPFRPGCRKALGR